MKSIGLILLLCSIAFSFRTIEDKGSDIILPQIIHENEEITIYAIKDSINIDSDSLFFHIDMFMQDMSYVRGYVPIINGKAKFTVPKNAALFMGYFYSIDDKEVVTYIRRIHNKEGKIVRNAYRHAYELRMEKNDLKKELSNHPTNLMAYANYVSYLAQIHSYGEVSDTLLRKEAKESLKKIEKKVDTKEPSDLAALAILYAYNQQFDKSKEILYKLLNNHPNSNFLNVAFSSYISSYSLYTERNDDYFMDSFIEMIGKYNPQSPFGRGNMLGMYSGNKWISKGYFKDEDIIANNNYNFQYMDSTLEYSINANIEAYLHQKDYENAKKWSNFILEEAKKGKWLHNIPASKKEREYMPDINTNINISIANSYHWMEYVETEAGDFESALSHIDSSLYFVDKNEIKGSLIYFRKFQLDRKASIQRKINQHNEALKTYETLYQESKEETVLDSIKVLFKEIKQEEGFESYAKNLKEKVENKTTETKKIASDFSIKDMSGYEIKLSDYKGKVVVLNFWANYCAPCIEEIPLLNTFWKEIQTKDIIFLAVTNDSPLIVQRFAQRQKEMFSFSVLPNAKEVSENYDVHILPTTIVIDKKGEIIHKESGFGGNIDKLKQVVLEELAK